MIYISSLVYLISSSMLQYVHHLQRKYSLGSFNLLGHTAPAQAASLLVLGPFVDFWLTNKRVDTFNYTSIVTVSDAYSGSVLLISSQNCFMRNLYISVQLLFFSGISLLISSLFMRNPSISVQLEEEKPLTWSRNTCLSISLIVQNHIYSRLEWYQRNFQDKIPCPCVQSK